MIKSQRGASLYSIGILIVVVLFFAKFGIEVVPKYLTNIEYKSHIESTLEKFAPDQIVSKREFYEAFRKTVKVNNWPSERDITKDATFVRKDGKYEVHLKYTDKSNLVKDIDVSISFDQTFTSN